MNPFLGIFIGGFVGGIALSSLAPSFGGSNPFIFSTLLLFLSLALFIYHFLSKKGDFLYVIFLAFFVGSVGLGVARFDLSDLNQGDMILERVVEKNVMIEGIVVDEPDNRESSTRLTIDVKKVYYGNEWVEVSSRALVSVNLFPEYAYGDEIRFSGTLKKPKNFRQDLDDIGRPFDYISYLKKDGIFYQMFYPDSEYISGGKGNPFRERLFALKRVFIENVKRVVPEPASSLLGGVVVGAKESLGEELLDDFRKTGIIHIVVLSGYNITIVAEAVGRIARFLPRVIGLSLSSAFIVGFALMVGAGATIVRASIMALLVLFARATGRIHAITSALFIAGFIMLMHNPKILIYDPSFQLSFLATIGLIHFSPLVERFVRFVPKKFQIRDVVSATVATQLFVLPLLLYMMGEMSLVAIPVNLLILIFVPVTMLLGFLIALFGLISPLLSLPFAYGAYFLLSYDLLVVDFFSKLPFASVSIDTFPVWLMVIIYIFYIYIIMNNELRLSSQGIKNYE